MYQAAETDGACHSGIAQQTWSRSTLNSLCINLYRVQHTSPAPTTVSTTINRQNLMALIFRYPCILNLYNEREVQVTVFCYQIAQYRGQIGGTVEHAELIDWPKRTTQLESRR